MKYKIVYDINGYINPKEFWNNQLFCSPESADKTISKMYNKNIKEYNDYLLSVDFRLFKITICQDET